MTLLALTPNLTSPHESDFQRSLKKTHAGMAHFAATGPKGSRCWQCVHWTDHALAVRPNATVATLKPATCRKFKQLTNKQGQKIPHSASACKYFEGDR